jgi:hypothetical protein
MLVDMRQSIATITIIALILLVVVAVVGCSKVKLETPAQVSLEPHIKVEQPASRDIHLSIA